MIYEVMLDGSGGKSVVFFLDGKVKQVNSILRLMFMPMERTLLMCWLRQVWLLGMMVGRKRINGVNDI